MRDHCLRDTLLPMRSWFVVLTPSPNFAELKREAPDPRRACERKLQVDAMFTKLQMDKVRAALTSRRTERVDPRRHQSRIDNWQTLPRCARPWTEVLLPRHAIARSDNEDPTPVCASTEAKDPSRANDRNEKLDPKAVKFKTLALQVMSTMQRTDTDEPTFVNPSCDRPNPVATLLRMDKLEPQCANARQLRLEPKRVRLLTLKDDPNVTDLITLARRQLPAWRRPSMLTPEPARTNARTLQLDPSSVCNVALTFEPQRIQLRRLRLELYRTHSITLHSQTLPVMNRPLMLNPLPKRDPTRMLTLEPSCA
jgi:hypothetical protein